MKESLMEKVSTIGSTDIVDFQDTLSSAEYRARRGQNRDLAREVRANLDLLDDLHQRLNFLMTDIKKVISRH